MNFFHVFHVVVCFLLIAVILFQDGKAGGLTSVSDSSQSVFGAKGAGSFLNKLTTILAILFMATSLFLNFANPTGNESIASDYVPETSQSAPEKVESLDNAGEETPSSSEAAEGKDSTEAASSDETAKPEEASDESNNEEEKK